MPATSAGLPRVSFFFSFLLLQESFTVLIEQTKQAVQAVTQSIYSYMSRVQCHIDCSTVAALTYNLAPVHLVSPASLELFSFGF